MSKGIKSLILKAVPPGVHSAARPVYKWLYSLYYAGTRHKCPSCGAYLRKFIPDGIISPLFPDIVGARWHTKGRCPRCDTMPRHRLMHLFIMNKTGLFRDRTRRLNVLQFAPEYSTIRLMRKYGHIKYFSADLYSRFAEYKMDILDIKFESNFFNAVLCQHVLEHIEDDIKAMKELFRVLKPGGWAILQVPVRETVKTFENPAYKTPEDRLKFYGQSDHVRIYGWDYKERLESAGFKVEVIDYPGELGPEAIERYGLDKDEKVYFCTRR